MDFDHLFQRATGISPYPFQRSLALAPTWPTALSAPTGAGKTAAAVLGWLYRRRHADVPIRAATPRRLVFCLPMRTLVSQTESCARSWFTRLECLATGKGPSRDGGVGVHTLMGGAVDDDWHLHPERDAVLVGTQDMLLSRALNRGYASSRFRWPWEYALLNNDCLWVFDEVQLMGVGLATGLQLAALREKLQTFGPAHSLFMSATLERSWLETVDHPAPADTHTLSEADRAAPELTRRRCAVKSLTRCKVPLIPGDKASTTALAAEVLAHHVSGKRTLVVVNRVATAVALYGELMRRAAKGSVEVVLLHSRFRPGDRERAVARAIDPDFTGIVVATQVVEAGVDMTSHTLFTEIAPWPSVVQRAGRCNRRGEESDARVIWIDHEPDDKAREKAAAPYDAAELAAARAHLDAMTSFNPEAVEARGVRIEQAPPSHVVRRRDVIDLFDTTADLAGADLDVSRFIRDGEERDVQVFWRDIVGKSPDRKEPRPRREELCTVPLGHMKKWLEGKRDAWRWNALDGVWESVRADKVFPGLTLMLRARDGGYDSARGWDDTQTTTPVAVVPPKEREELPEESVRDDFDARLSQWISRTDPSSDSQLKQWVTLTTHSTDARDAAQEIVDALSLPGDLSSHVVRAAHAHDAGKGHEAFQTMMTDGYSGTDPGPWAKSGSKARNPRRGFRHELASALAWLAVGDESERDLVAYLLAAHHGKVRLSIRALPNDVAPERDPERLHARGVWDGDTLPAADLGGGLSLPAVRLSLEPMRIGRSALGPSWLDRATALRERFGPFRLALLEALVRAADVRASMREAEVSR